MNHSIADAANHSGLSIDTLRYYERIGLLDPPRRDAHGRRTYSERDLAWLVFLTRLRTTGMPIKTMREFARLRHDGPASAGHRKQILLHQRSAVLERIEQLRACVEILEYKIDNYEQIENKHTDMFAEREVPA